MSVTRLPARNGKRVTEYTGHQGELHFLPANSLLIDRTYQRGLNEARVVDLIEDFDDDAFGILLVSSRHTGHYIMDGQHRQRAVVQMGKGTSLIPCYVMTGLSVQQEADIFWRLNKVRLQPGSADTFRARLVAGEPVAIGLQSAMNRHGVQIMYHPAQLKPNEIYAISAAERIFRAGDLDWVLGVLREGWADVPSALRQDRLLGMARFYDVWRGLFSDQYPEGVNRRTHLIGRMRDFTPSVIVDKAIEYRATLHSRPATAFARGLHFYFNYRLQNNPVRLPAWPVQGPSNHGTNAEE